MVNQSTIFQSVERILEKYQPLTAYIYGSYAYGTPNKESDLDLFVVTQENPHQLYRSLAKEFWNFDIPVEMVIYHETVFQKKLEWNELVQMIVKKGIQLN